MTSPLLIAGRYSPISFLQTMQQGLADSPYLDAQGRAILSTKIEGLIDRAQDFEDVYPVVRTVWYLLARDYVRQLPQAKAAVFPLSRVDEPLSMEKFSQGRTVDEQADIEEELLVEVHHPLETLSDSKPIWHFLQTTEDFALAPTDEPAPVQGDNIYAMSAERTIPLITEQGGLDYRSLFFNNFSYRLLPPRTLLTSRKVKQDYRRLKPAYVNNAVSRRDLVDFLKTAYWPIEVPLQAVKLYSWFSEEHPLIRLLSTVDNMQHRERNSDAVLAVADCMLSTALSVFPDYAENDVEPVSFIIDQSIRLSEWRDVDELLEVLSMFRQQAEGIVIRGGIDLRTMSQLAGGGLVFFTAFESSLQALSERSPSATLDELLFKLQDLHGMRNYGGHA